jgi:hypothetical protein
VHYAAYDDEDWADDDCVGAAVDSEAWSYFVVPSKKDGPPTYKTPETSTILGWDSHTSVTMTFDAADHLRLSGNMHCHKLTYFRTAEPLDIPSLHQVVAMVGRNEDSCTYPMFMRGPIGELVFRYRDGSSGNGVDYYNVYDTDTQTWRRLIDQPLLDRLDRMNAYSKMPELGPDGWLPPGMDVAERIPM